MLRDRGIGECVQICGEHELLVRGMPCDGALPLQGLRPPRDGRAVPLRDDRRVSFEGIDFVEIPDESGNCPHGGYYDDTDKGGMLSHGAAAGAGVFFTVTSSGYWSSDKCGVGGRYERPWADGWKEWPIPVGWGIKPTVLGCFAKPATTQRFSLTASGTFTIRKYKYEATRVVDGASTWREVGQ